MEPRSLSPRVADAPIVSVIGMGTSQSIDRVDADTARDVVLGGLDAGTTLFDSSPMYGEAERILSESLGRRRSEAVVATKVWTEDDDEAEAQIQRSLDFYGGRIDVLQIHNMVRWEKRLEQIEAHRDAGRVGLVGATHWKIDGFVDLEAAMRTGRIDLVQIPYSPLERVVEQRLLPLAAEMGIGVLLMRPFAKGGLLGDPPPADALAPLADAGIDSWTAALLAWGVSHPAVSATIPATSKPDRAVANAAVAGATILTDDQRDLVADLALSRATK